MMHPPNQWNGTWEKSRPGEKSDSPPVLRADRSPGRRVVFARRRLDPRRATGVPTEAEGHEQGDALRALLVMQE